MYTIKTEYKSLYILIQAQLLQNQKIYNIMCGVNISVYHVTLCHSVPDFTNDFVTAESSINIFSHVFVLLRKTFGLRPAYSLSRRHKNVRKNSAKNFFKIKTVPYFSLATMDGKHFLC